MVTGAVGTDMVYGGNGPEVSRNKVLDAAWPKAAYNVGGVIWGGAGEVMGDTSRVRVRIPLAEQDKVLRRPSDFSTTTESLVASNLPSAVAQERIWGSWSGGVSTAWRMEEGLET